MSPFLTGMPPMTHIWGSNGTAGPGLGPLASQVIVNPTPTVINNYVMMREC